jgi:2-deoxy-D-gluconate 3-dehydrogenase
MGILDLFSLSGRKALVTGAAKGIGQAIAVALGQAGADVACLDVIPCDDTLAGLNAAGRRGFSILCDLRTAGLVELGAAVERVVSEWGRLDILVNAAGITRPNPALEINEKDFDDEMLINQKALFFLSQAAARHMAAAGGGKIIHIASDTSFNGGINVATYAGTKGAVASFTRALASELAAKGVHVNAIAPGYTETDNTRNLIQDAEIYEKIRSQVPARRWAKPADFQGPAVFLASPASDYLDGSVVVVDGGWLIR